MFDKNDPLIDAVKKVMQTNAAEREAEKSVNEKFGIQDLKALPHEYLGEWNAEYKSVLSEGIEALDEAKGKRPLPGVNSPAASKIRDIAGPGLVQHAEPWHESHKDHNIFTHSNESDSFRKVRAFKVHQQTGKVSEIKNYVHGMGEEALDEADKDKFAGARNMPYIVKKGVKKLPLTPMPNATKPPKDKFANGVNLEEGGVDTVGKGENEGGSAVTYIKRPINNAKKVMGDLRKGDAESNNVYKSENLAHQGNSVVTKTGKNSSSVTPSTMKENSITSIQEEISYNLAEEAFNIYESNGQDEFLQYIDSLNEEQIDLLVVNEEFMQFVINEGLWDSISAGARGAWDSATLGGGKYVVGGVKHLYNKATGKKSSYSDEVDKEVAASEKAQKDHPTAYTVGNYGADAAMLATGGGAIARFAAKQALKAGVKSAAKTAASKKSGIAKATDSVSGIGLGVGTAGHAGAGLSGQHKGLYEDVTIFTEQLSDYLYENYTLEELYALTEEQVDQIVDENWKTDALEYGGKLVSKIPGVDNLVKKTSDWMSRGTTKAAGTTTKATNTTVDAGQLAADNAKKAKDQADALAKNAANKKVVAGAKPVKPVEVPASPSAGKKGVQAPPKMLTKGQKVLEIAKNNKAKLAAIAAGTAAVATAGLSGDSNPKTASATGEDGAFDRNKTPTTSDSSKVPPKPKLKPANPGKAAPKAAAPVKPVKKSKSKMKLQRKSKIPTKSRRQQDDMVAGPNQKPYRNGKPTY